jgi:hypothetical protein
MDFMQYQPKDAESFTTLIRIDAASVNRQSLDTNTNESDESCMICLEQEPDAILIECGHRFGEPLLPSATTSRPGTIHDHGCPKMPLSCRCRRILNFFSFQFFDALSYFLIYCLSLPDSAVLYHSVLTSDRSLVSLQRPLHFLRRAAMVRRASTAPLPAVPCQLCWRRAHPRHACPRHGNTHLPISSTLETFIFLKLYKNSYPPPPCFSMLKPSVLLTGSMLCRTLTPSRPRSESSPSTTTTATTASPPPPPLRRRRGRRTRRPPANRPLPCSKWPRSRLRLRALQALRTRRWRRRWRRRW